MILQHVQPFHQINSSDTIFEQFIALKGNI